MSLAEPTVFLPMGTYNGDNDARCLFTRLYGADNNEFTIIKDPESLRVHCKTHNVDMTLQSQSFTHFHFVGEKDFCSISCLIPAFESVRGEHVIRFESSNGAPFSAVVLKRE